MKSESTKQIKQNGLVKELLKDTTGQKSFKSIYGYNEKETLQYDAIKLTYHNGKERWHPKARPCMKNNDDLEILCQYNGRYEAFTTIIHWRITVILLILL